MKVSGERRSAPRVRLRAPMRYQLIPIGGDGYRSASIEDLSLTGVRFRCLGAVRPKVGLLLELLLPGGRPVHSFGRAAWVRELPDRDGFVVGSRFVDQSTSARRTLERQLGG